MWLGGLLYNYLMNVTSEWGKRDIDRGMDWMEAMIMIMRNVLIGFSRF